MILLTRIILAALFLSVGSSAQDPKPFHASGSLHKELSVSWILDQIDRHGIKTIDDLLARFPEKALERNLLAYHSESLQGATFKDPRAIVYSYDGDFIMAFNGDPKAKGYYELEILTFDHENARFDPQLISFDPKGAAKPNHEFRPSVCFECHQKDARPNWEPYFHWPGFYGAEDDFENAGFDNKGNVLKKGRDYVGLQAFLERKKADVLAKTGRYRFLPDHPGARPNLDFNDRVTCLNMKRMLRMFSENEKAPKLLPAVYGGRLNLDQVPAELFVTGARTFDDVHRDTDRVFRTAMERRVQRHTKVTGERPLGRVRDNENGAPEDNLSPEIEPSVAWRYVFEDILGVSAAGMSTSRHPDFNLNIGAAVDLGTLLSGATVDDKTGKVVLSRSSQDRDSHPYGYVCPRSPSYFDLGVKKDDYRDFTRNWLQLQFTKFTQENIR